jgi:hypothetical protein
MNLMHLRSAGTTGFLDMLVTPGSPLILEMVSVRAPPDSATNLSKKIANSFPAEHDAWWY